MDPSKLPPMRSGIGTSAIATQQDDLDFTRKRLIATVAVMTRKAGQYALCWALHDNRQEVTPSDINVALKHQAKHFLSTVDRPDVIEEIEDMERVIFDAMTSEDSADEDSEESETDDTAASLSKTSNGPYYERIECNGQCVCSLCTEIREAVDTWDSWIPEDEAELYLKNSVNLAIAAAQQKIPLE